MNKNECTDPEFKIHIKYEWIMGCGASSSGIIEDNSLRGSAENFLATETAMNGLKVRFIDFFI